MSVRLSSVFFYEAENVTFRSDHDEAFGGVLTFAVCCVIIVRDTLPMRGGLRAVSHKTVI